MNLVSLVLHTQLMVLADMEPFDEGFDRHIWSLSDQSLRWDLQIARERRTKPEEIERQMRELLASQAELDAEEAAALTEVGEDDVRIAEESTLRCSSMSDALLMAFFSSSGGLSTYRRRCFANVRHRRRAEAGMAFFCGCPIWLFTIRYV